MKKAFLLGCAVFVLAACETVSVAPYSVSPQNVAALRSQINSGSSGISIGTFTQSAAAPTSINCRGAILDVTQGRGWGDYFQDALQQELLMASAYTETGGRVVSLTVDNVTLDTLGDSQWVIVGTVQAGGGAPFVVTYAHPFQSSVYGSSACPMAGAAFGLAARGFIASVIERPEFRGSP